MVTDHELRMEALKLYEENKQLKASARSMMATILSTIGGTVEGQPTSEINYLQRLRQLVEIERDCRENEHAHRR